MTFVQVLPAGQPPAQCCLRSTGVLVTSSNSVPFPQKMLLLIIGLLLPLYIPPPSREAELPLKVTFVSVGLLLSLYIPPP